MTEAKGVEAVERALKILECFGPGVRDLSLAELARQTGEYKSTLLRLMVSLERFGYLVRLESGRYRLGGSLWRLGVCYRDSFDLTEILRPEVQRLCEVTNETASFYIREGDSRICLFRAEPGRAIRHALSAGARLPLQVGASGRVLLAYSGDDSAASQATRTAGHAVSHGERDPEVAAIAVPVLSRRGELLGALTVSGLITRFSPDRVPALLEELLRSRARLSERVQGPGTF